MNPAAQQILQQRLDSDFLRPASQVSAIQCIALYRDDTRRVPYRLPQLLAATERGETVWIVEGEKDVHTLMRAGVTATCNPQGAGKWQPEFRLAARPVRPPTTSARFGSHDVPRASHISERGTLPAIGFGSGGVAYTRYGNLARGVRLHRDVSKRVIGLWSRVRGSP